MTIPDKVALRNHYLTQRDQLDVSSWLRGSSMIRQRIFQHPAWKDATTVLCYVSFGTEVDTQALLKEATRYKKRIVVPLFDPKRPTKTQISELKRFGDLVPAKNPNLLEPTGQARKIVAPEEVDLALVPGSVFDHQGARLGFGGGYFDRLLALMPQATRWGLCFDAQISEQPLPQEPHDLRMHKLITEKAVIDIA